MTDKIILYGHSTCPAVGPIRGLLAQAGVPFEYVDIHRDSAAAQTVRELNQGYESVPTLLFPDGSALTEPSFGELKARLEALGYTLGFRAWLIGHAWWLIIGAGLLIALLRVLGVM